MTGEGEEMVTVYEGVLLKTNDNVQSKPFETINWYPLLLYSGTNHQTMIF